MRYGGGVQASLVRILSGLGAVQVQTLSGTVTNPAWSSVAGRALESIAPSRVTRRPACPETCVSQAFPEAGLLFRAREHASVAVVSPGHVAPGREAGCVDEERGPAALLTA